MGFAVIIFIVLLLTAALSISVVNYGIDKDSQVAPLKAEIAYADREAGRSYSGSGDGGGSGKGHTDFVVTNTKINGTATYTSTDPTEPNLLNLYLTIKNNGSIVLDPRKYSIILNNSWVWINSTSDNSTPPFMSSQTTSFGLAVTPKNSPMRSLSLIVSAENGIKIITPSAPIINYLDITGNKSGADKNCWKDANISWINSTPGQSKYGDVWPVLNYTVYYTNEPTEQFTKNNYFISFTTASNTNMFIGRAFRSTSQGGTCADLPAGNSTFLIWITASDTHGNEGPPSNTCIATGQGAGTVHCNYPPVV